MIDYQLITPLKGNLSITSRYDEDIKLQQDKSLYKFIWVQSGTITVEIDHVVTQLHESEIITLTPLHHFEVIKRDGTYLTFVFNSNFYCIFGHDNEVSCNGFLFHGSSHIMKLKLTAEQSDSLNDIVRVFCKESCIQDNLQEEMLRILLKRFIITCTRFAREKYSITHEKEKSFDMVRQFYVLVDNHYKEKKQVQEYADLLHRSPKTLSNLMPMIRIVSISSDQDISDPHLLSLRLQIIDKLEHRLIGLTRKFFVRFIINLLDIDQKQINQFNHLFHIIIPWKSIGIDGNMDTMSF